MKETKYGNLSIEEIDMDALKTLVLELENINKSELTEEKVKMLVEELSILIETTGYFDAQYKWMNEGLEKNRNSYEGDGLLGKFQQYAQMSSDKTIKYKSKEILLSGKDNRYQYDIDKYPDRTRSELLANVMELSNILSHILSEISDEEKNYLRKEGINPRQTSQKLFNLKNLTTHELIKCKQNGENLLISMVDSSQDGEKVFIVAIPGYFEPFRVHRKDEYSKEELEVCSKDSKWEKMKLKTTLPFKVTPEKQELFEYVYRNIEDKEIAPTDKKRIRWYFETQDELKKLKENKTEKENKKITGKRSNNNLKEGNSKLKEKVDIQKSNLEFTNKINEELGNIFSPGFIKGFTERASYSFEDVYSKKLHDAIYEKLECVEVPEEKKELEALKVFVYMRMTKKMSMINAGNIHGEELDVSLDDAVLDYDKAFEFLSSEKAQGLDYKETTKEMEIYMGHEVKRTGTRKKASRVSKKVNEKTKNDGEQQLSGTELETETEVESAFQKDIKKLKELRSNQKENETKKSNLKASVVEIKEKRSDLKQEIKEGKGQLQELEKLDLSNLDNEEQQSIIQEIISLRLQIESKKALRKQLKDKKVVLKQQIKLLKENLKSNEQDIGKAIDEIEL